MQIATAKEVTVVRNGNDHSEEIVAVYINGVLHHISKEQFEDMCDIEAARTAREEEGGGSYDDLRRELGL